MPFFSNIPPLDWQTPIVDPETGRPSNQFIRLWQSLFKNGDTAQDELENKADKSTLITAGAGLTGGGDLSEDRTIDVGAGTGITVTSDAVNLSDTAVTPGTYGDADNVPQITVDQQGRITDVVDIPIAGGGSGPEAWNVTATGTGSSQVVTIPEAGLPANRVLVFVNGIRFAVSEYSISGVSLTLTTNASGDAIEVVRGVGTAVSPGIHAWWRITVSLTQGGGFPALGGLEVRPTAGVANPATGGTPTVSSTLFGSASEAWNATTSTAWVSGGAAPQWAAYHFPSALGCAEFAVKTSVSFFANEGPKDFVIEYSDDGVSYTVAKVVTGEPAWTAGEQRLYSVP